MIISVLSGRSGTGKTLVATSLALSLADEMPVQFLDCSVEQPDAHIFLKPDFTRSETVMTTVPTLDEDKCTHCGKCGEICTRSAIVAFARHILIFPELCAGCGSCSFLCPEKAITEQTREIGVVESGQAGTIGFIHGRLSPGEVLALPVIKKIKEQAGSAGTTIIDTIAGTSYLAAETVKGSDFCIIVTEPTSFGLNTLARAVKTLIRLEVPCGVVMNGGGEEDSKIREYCENESLPLLLTIPLESEIARLYSVGTPLVEGIPEWKDRFSGLFDKIAEIPD